jgi:hypothetical protein
MSRKQRRHKQDVLFGNSKTKKRRRRVKRENRNRGWTATSVGAEAFSGKM